MYDFSAVTANVPLGSEDVEALLLTDGGELAGDRRKVRHLLTRVRATLGAQQEQLLALRRSVEEMRQAAARRMKPVAAALDALASMSIEDQRLVYDRRAQVLLDAVQDAQGRADDALVAAASQVNRARLVLAQAAGLPGLTPQAVRLLALAVDELQVVSRPALAPVPAVPEGAFVVEPVVAHP